jgi:hypothetical protein
MTRAAALILFLLSVFAATFLSGAAAQRGNAQTNRHLEHRDSSPASYGWAICNTTDILTMVDKGGPLYDQPKVASLLVQARIAACKRTINQYVAALSPVGSLTAQNPPGLPPLPAPAPQATAPRGCSVSYPGTATPITDKPMLLYSSLTFCVSWISKNISAAGGGSPTPQPIGFHTPFAGSLDPWNKTVYIMALASDPMLSAQIALQLANNLRDSKANPHSSASPKFQRDIYSNRTVKYVVLAAPTWGLDKYQQQCFNDPSTAGAIVAVQPSLENRTYNLFYSASTSVLNMQLMVIDCEPTNTSYLNNAAYITWLSHVRSGSGTRVNLNLATILAAGAIYYGVQAQKTTTYAVGTPTAIPVGSAFQSLYTVSSRSTNEASTSLGAATALGAAAAFGEVPSTDSQTSAAIKSLLPQLVDDLI